MHKKYCIFHNEDAQGPGQPLYLPYPRDNSGTAVLGPQSFLKLYLSAFILTPMYKAITVVDLKICSEYLKHINPGLSS